MRTSSTESTKLEVREFYCESVFRLNQLFPQTQHEFLHYERPSLTVTTRNDILLHKMHFHRCHSRLLSKIRRESGSVKSK